MEENNNSQNKRFYCNTAVCYCVDEFENVKTLDEEHTRVALRIIKEHFDKHMGFETSDALFEAIFDRVPHLYPCSPLGSGIAMMGYIVPIKQILKEHCVDESLYSKVLGFFGLPKHRRW